MSEPLNILVVDDDRVILGLFKDFLRRRDSYSIFTARDGAEALKILEQTKIDFCFTDLQMPGMDGIEFARKLHDLDNTIPVVVMTSYPSMDNAIATLKHGVVDYLVKPFKSGEIELTIKRALEQKALFVENMLLKEEIKRKERIDRLNEELANKVGDLKILNMILQEVDWITKSSDIFDLVVQVSADITRCDEAYFYVMEESAGGPILISSFHKGPETGTNGGKAGQADQGRTATEDNSHIIEVFAKKISEGAPFIVNGDHDKVLSDANICSLVTLPFKIRNKLFGVLVAIARHGSEPFTDRELYYLNFLAERATFVIENVALYENIYENLFSTLYAFVEAIEARDPYTKDHSTRVTRLAQKIGKEMGYSDNQLDPLNFSGHLHDIGKLGVPDNILLKPGPLTEKEYKEVKKHPIIGANIVSHLGLLDDEQKIILHHHERWDGKGYPIGLKGKEIPILARILAVADVYDAMASDRAYRKRLDEDVVIKTIHQSAGTQFDEEVVDAFSTLYEKGKVREQA